MRNCFDSEGFEINVNECLKCNKKFLDSDNPDIPSYYYCPFCKSPLFNINYRRLK